MKTTIPIKLNPDEKGYIDRKCPNENCEYTFKIHIDDLAEKFSDDEVHCPLCGHIASSDNWWTQEQQQSIQEYVMSWGLNYIESEVNKSFKKLAQSTKNNKSFKITYKPGRKLSITNNPIEQREEWETEITCKECGTRYSVIGFAYFCPCCGYNSAVDVFTNSLDRIEKILYSLAEMRENLASSYDIDTAESMCRGFLEDSIGNIISAFQDFACRIYNNITGETEKPNVFQNVDKGSQRFEEKTTKSYRDFLSESELQRMKKLFQRRHVLEHKAGIVDQDYIKKSGDTSYVVGQRLVVKESDAYELLTIIRKLSTGLESIAMET